MGVTADPVVGYGDATIGVEQSAFLPSPSGGLPHDLGDVFGSGGTTAPVTDASPDAIAGGLGNFIEGLASIVKTATAPAAPPASTNMITYVAVGVALGAGGVWLLKRR